MKVDGRKIALKLQENLQKVTDQLASRQILPHLAVIQIGNDHSSQIYVNQKVKTAKKLNLKVTVYRFNQNIAVSKLTGLIDKLNMDNQVHGIIIQRPVMLHIDKKQLNLLVAKNKDVDGFHPQSLFDPPLVLAVLEILKSVHSVNFLTWLKNQRILVIGRGETAGKPIAKYFSKKCLQLQVAHSQTTDLKKLCFASDIIIPCVGRADIVRHNMVKPTTILIGVGLHPEGDKLKADYNQESIAKKVAFYTPVPGGVGPVNVTMLFYNLIKAAKLTQTL